ncbi:dihydrolipoyl dehydrogenase family protein [Donghicola mangrovi]|uniref:FAD-dependent oxidoreductase n=1 Tax=Donghicola mangrovi TaxID=2729614 RepID=A0A850PYJ6_9RHOB|nr:FAD-dependent oxidoreductase [Donghicola mangrovi]NVO21893.1 FAD-dependent oxidoreductase [Donghicola mangrovi]
MNRINADLLVIGAGSGGLSVASGAAQMGARVVLLERGEMGGDCLNYGCVPSKALIASAARARQVATAAEFGVNVSGVEIDYARVKDRVAEVIATIAPHDSQARFESLGVTVIREEGRFVSDREVLAGDHHITARRIVIATGSRPLVPHIPGLEDTPYLTNETLFALRDRPEHLLIIGGGPIGLEMAQAHVRLGSRVTVLETAHALGKEDRDAAALVLDSLRAEGVDIHEYTSATRVGGTTGAIWVETNTDHRFECSHLLIAAGRKPNTEALDLAKAGIDFDKTGIAVDGGLRTSNRRVYAIGDVTGGMQFTHVAGYHAGIIIRSALFGLPAKTRSDHIPRATYTDPELAQIGLTEEDAKHQYADRLEVVKFAYSGNDRATATGKTDGWIKIMVVKGRPVGVTIVGADAGEIINLWALVLANGYKISHLAGMVSPYPTVGEISKRVAGNYFAPRLFDNKMVKYVVRAVQTLLP